jgi:hypothetical protein
MPPSYGPIKSAGIAVMTESRRNLTAEIAGSGKRSGLWRLSDSLREALRPTSPRDPNELPVAINQTRLHSE